MSESMSKPMSRKSDRELGMGSAISRRDFIHDLGLLSGLGLMGLPVSVGAGQGDPAAAGLYYPPTRTGLRGSHPGAFEVAHALAREGQAFANPQDLDERWDLIVVGGGISGLAAAYYWRKLHGPDARILVLDNHDDFGGHAKRNEFHLDGQMRLAWGGTVNMEYPKYSPVAMGLIEELGIDIPRLLKDFTFRWETGNEFGLQSGIFFDAAHYGRDVFLPGVRLLDMDPAELSAQVAEFPLPEADKAALRAFLDFQGDVLDGMDEAARQVWLRSTSYTDFLVQRCGLPESACQVFMNSTFGYWGVPADNLSVVEALESGLPGLHALGGTQVHTEDAGAPGGGSAMFPDGNSSIARLLVRALVPAAVPGLPAGADAHDIVTAELRYAELDRPGNAVSIRLNATVVQVENRDGEVAISYVHDGKLLRVRAGQTVLACYNQIIPHICPALPETQKTALAQCVKRPMLIVNVALRNGEAIARSRRLGGYLPGRMLQSLFPVSGVKVGQYRPEWRPEDPCLVQFYCGVAAPQPQGLSIVERHRAARAHLLAMTFEDFEREVREVLDGIYGESGFDAASDITAITVNRWPHGYARDHLDLEDAAWNADPPPNVVGRARCGRIAIANSDAGADAYTHTAIDQAWRAVNELRDSRAQA